MEILVNHPPVITIFIGGMFTRKTPSSPTQLLKDFEGI